MLGKHEVYTRYIGEILRIYKSYKEDSHRLSDLHEVLHEIFGIPLPEFGGLVTIDCPARWILYI